MSKFPEDGVQYNSFDGESFRSLIPSAKYPGYWYLNTVKDGILEGWPRPMHRDGIEFILSKLSDGIPWVKIHSGCDDPEVFVNRGQIEKVNPLSEVYFIETIGAPFVKIGVTQRGCSHVRLTQIANGCPFQLRVLFALPGGFLRERQLHKQFGHLRVRGEWFRFTNEIRDFISHQSQ